MGVGIGNLFAKMYSIFFASTKFELHPHAIQRKPSCRRTASRFSNNETNLLDLSHNEQTAIQLNRFLFSMQSLNDVLIRERWTNRIREGFLDSA